MAYVETYKSEYDNERQERVVVSFQKKGGASITPVTYHGYLSQTSDSTFTILSDVVIPELIVGRTISFGGNDYIITAVVYNTLAIPKQYEITIGAGGLTGGSFGFEDYTISLPSGSPVVENLKVRSCEINKNSDNGLYIDPIITQELQVTLFIPRESTIDFNTFIFSNHDDWQVTVTIDGVFVFHGFLIPDESPIQMQDKPYEITLRATDGIKLLSKVAISQVDGSEFNKKHLLIEYLTGILVKTNLQLNIKIYCNIYYNPMDTRETDITNDIFDQVKLDYRTFMKSSTEFVDCYTALQILFEDHFQLYYDKGEWVLYRIPEKQYLPEGNRYWTRYSYTGATVDGGIDEQDYAQVGYRNLIRAINDSGIISARFANKTVRHEFKYNIWDELPRNNKFERGTYIPGISDATHKYYTIDNWEYGKTSSLTYPLVPLTPTTRQVYRISTLNTFGVELDRVIELETGGVDNDVLLSDGIPVNKFDKVTINFDSLLKDAFGSGPGSYFPAYVILLSPTTGLWSLVNNDINNITQGHWVNVKSTLATDPNDTNAFNFYRNNTISSDNIPDDGELRVAFRAQSTDGSTALVIKGFTLEYFPYVAGGYIPVTGDYWTRSQTNNFPDTYNKELQISDSPVGAGKGCLWYGPDGSEIKTVTDWYRYGLIGYDIRHYKEIVNIGMYNLTYRRFLKVEGEFDGTKYSVNATGDQFPLSFTPRYGFNDLEAKLGYLPLFAMCCPVKMDLVKGWFTATFIEVYGSSADGTQEGDSSEFKFLFK